MRDCRSDQACSILSHATVEVRLSEVAGLRDSPGPTAGPALPKRFLRYCDEQTVVGMAAVLEAIHRFPSPRPSFDRWGVLSASCQAGRTMGAQALIATKTAGSQGVTPHVVPQCSLHSPASAVSVGLGMHGPHFGIGGGIEAFDEGILLACSLLARGMQPSAEEDATFGVWLMLTAWEQEPSLDGSGVPRSDPTCCGVALALMPGRVAGAECIVDVRQEPVHADARPAVDGLPPIVERLRSLGAAISGGDSEDALRLRHGFTLHMHASGSSARVVATEAA